MDRSPRAILENVRIRILIYIYVYIYIPSPFGISTAYTYILHIIYNVCKYIRDEDINYTWN